MKNTLIIRALVAASWSNPMATNWLMDSSEGVNNATQTNSFSSTLIKIWDNKL